MSDRPPARDDIQGNILGGFNTAIQALVGFSVGDAAKFAPAAAWLSDLAPALTVVSQVRQERAAMKSGAAGPWLAVALGHRLLASTRSDLTIRDDAFNGGMDIRASSVLGDATAPADWKVGSPAKPLDALLIVAANDETAVLRRADELSASAAGAGLTETSRLLGRRLEGREHFGFRDGISQPAIAGDEAGGTVGLGHFVFGYPKVPNGAVFLPVIDPNHIADNGSLLVFRRPEQGAEKFRNFCVDETARLSQAWPGLSSDKLAALIVGRWPSGAPVRQGQLEDPEGEPPDNSFDFRDDPDGASCPFGAHVRKVNPRAGPKDVSEVPRMLRRGIPFGLPGATVGDGEDRGLAFLAYQTSIKAQFEFLTRNWMNSPSNPAKQHDIFVGRAAGLRTMKIVGPHGPIEVSVPELGWIVPTGGAYLFAPGRTGLSKLKRPTAAIGLWKAQQIWTNVSDAVRTTIFE